MKVTSQTVYTNIHTNKYLYLKIEWTRYSCSYYYLTNLKGSCQGSVYNFPCIKTPMVPELSS